MRAFLRRTNWWLVPILVLGGWQFLQHEGLARAEEAARFPPSRFRPDPFTGYRLRDFPSERPGEVPEINADGLRGPPVEPAPSDEVRILCLGDSYTLGMHVPQPLTFAGRLEAMLRGRGVFARVINGGVDGFGLAHMRRLLDDFYDRCAPAVIVVTFGDVMGETYTPIDPTILWRLRLHGLALRSELVRRGLLRLHGAEGFSAWQPEVPFGHDDFQNAALTANLRAFEEFSREKGVPVLFVVSSYRDDKMPDDVALEVRRVLPAALWLDDAPAFKSLGTQAYLPNSPRHLGVAGHDAVAHVLADMLERSKVLP